MYSYLSYLGWKVRQNVLTTKQSRALFLPLIAPARKVAACILAVHGISWHSMIVFWGFVCFVDCIFFFFVCFLFHWMDVSNVQFMYNDYSVVTWSTWKTFYFAYFLFRSKHGISNWVIVKSMTTLLNMSQASSQEKKLSKLFLMFQSPVTLLNPISLLNLTEKEGYFLSFLPFSSRHVYVTS